MGDERDQRPESSHGVYDLVSVSEYSRYEVARKAARLLLWSGCSGDLRARNRLHGHATSIILAAVRILVGSAFDLLEDAARLRLEAGWNEQLRRGAWGMGLRPLP
jgi:hypothetical protein